jgi:hypothetical protein
MERPAAFSIALASLALFEPLAAVAQVGPLAKGTPTTSTAIPPCLAPGIRRVRTDQLDSRQPLREEAVALRSMGPVPGPICEDCVTTVNGRTIARVTFTPSTSEIPAIYTITGNGFGDVAGGVFLTGPFRTRPELRVESWDNRQIKVYFPQGLRGESDIQGVGLTVRLQSGKLISTPMTARFLAAREEQVIDFADIPQNSVRWQSNTSLKMTIADGGLNFSGVNVGDSVKTGYIDRIVMDFLANGFAATSFSVGFCRQDTGDGAAYGGAGGRYLYGRYDARWEGDDIVIDRAMWHSHRSRNLLLPEFDAFESCFRDLRITVEGPAGLKPVL